MKKIDQLLVDAMLVFVTLAAAAIFGRLSVQFAQLVLKQIPALPGGALPVILTGTATLTLVAMGSCFAGDFMMIYRPFRLLVRPRLLVALPSAGFAAAIGYLLPSTVGGSIADIVWLVIASALLCGWLWMSMQSYFTFKVTIAVSIVKELKKTTGKQPFIRVSDGNPVICWPDQQTCFGINGIRFWRAGRINEQGKVEFHDHTPGIPLKSQRPASITALAEAMTAQLSDTRLRIEA